MKRKQKDNDMDFTYTSTMTSNNNDVCSFDNWGNDAEDEKISDADKIVSAMNHMRTDITDSIKGLRTTLFWIAFWLFLIFLNSGRFTV